MFSIEVRRTGTYFLRGISLQGRPSCTQLVHGTLLAVRLHRTLEYSDVDMWHGKAIQQEPILKLQFGYLLTLMISLARRWSSLTLWVRKRRARIVFRGFQKVVSSKGITVPFWAGFGNWKAVPRLNVEILSSSVQHSRETSRVLSHTLSTV